MSLLNKTKKKTTMAVSLSLVASLAIGFYLLSNNGDNDLKYRLGTVSRGMIVQSISATGTLNPVTTVQVGSQVSGTIAKLYADFNDVMKEGELLAQLDPTFLQATVNEQRANVSRSRAQVLEAERNHARISELHEKALVSQADMDAAATALEAARAELQQTEAALQRAEVNLRYATIRSPISGVVISRDVDVGQTVAASLQAPTLFTIARDLRNMQVEVTVDEADIGSVKAGQAVEFRVDAYPEDVFKGTVSQVRLGPTLNQNVVTYTVIVAVDNADLKLLPGMTATASIEISKRTDVLRVPVQAIRFRPPDEWTDRESSNGPGQPGGGERKQENPQPGTRRSRLWVLKDDRPEAIQAIVGLQDLQFAELVQSDLREGDEVIMSVEGGQSQSTQGPQNPFQPQMPTTRRRGMP